MVAHRPTQSHSQAKEDITGRAQLVSLLLDRRTDGHCCLRTAHLATTGWIWASLNTRTLSMSIIQLNYVDTWLLSTCVHPARAQWPCPSNTGYNYTKQCVALSSTTEESNYVVHAFPIQVQLAGAQHWEGRGLKSGKNITKIGETSCFIKGHMV